MDPSVLGGLKALGARGAAVEMAGAWAKITPGTGTARALARVRLVPWPAVAGRGAEAVTLRST